MSHNLEGMIPPYRRDYVYLLKKSIDDNVQYIAEMVGNSFRNIFQVERIEGKLYFQALQNGMTKESRVHIGNDSMIMISNPDPEYIKSYEKMILEQK